MNSPPHQILYAEDDPNDVLLMRYALDLAGLAIPLQAVANGQLAIDYLAGTGEYADRGRYPLPCLLLCDIKMPRRTGLEVLAWVRQQPGLRALVVVMFSGSFAQDEIDAAYVLGANSFLNKPVGLDELAGLMKLLHAYWFKNNRFASWDPCMR